MKLDEVTQANYYNEPQKQFMSATVYKSFLECEAKGVAIMNGSYNPFPNDNALLYGQFVHSAFESKEAHEKYIEENKDHFYTQKGTKRAETKNMDKAIQALKDNRAFDQLYLEPSNEYEKIVTGTIEPAVQGDIFSANYKAPEPIKWIGKLDMLNKKDKIIGDIKTSADYYKGYTNTNGNKEDFIRHWGYDTQLAIYQHLLQQETGDRYRTIIFVVSKKNFTTQAIEIPQIYLDNQLEQVREREQRIHDLMEEVNNGQESTAQPCGICDYCTYMRRRQARQSGVISLNDFNSLII